MIRVGPGPEHTLQVDGLPLSWRDVARGLREDAAVRGALAGAIASCPHPAVFWECSPVRRSDADQVMRFVVLPAAGLARVAPEPRPFPGLLRERINTVPNLGGDALLVIPRAQTTPVVYTHLASFLRQGPADQIHALWRAVGAAIETWWDRRTDPVWVSTSGLGVHWLHVRLDERPKYITHRPYRRAGPPVRGP